MEHKCVDRKALYHNISKIKEKIKDKAICAMVKADAYGHGIKTIVEMLKGRVDYFGVATIDEALTVRKIDKETPVVVAGNCEDKRILDAINNDISITIHSFAQMEIIKNKLSNNIKQKPMKIHVKINTGMNRLGIKSIDEFEKIQKILSENKNIIFEGIFTHFSSINCDKNYFEKQIIIFKLFLKHIFKQFSPIIHGGGSSLINKGFDNIFDMFRVGIYLYGYCEKFDKIKLKPILRIKSNIIEIQNIKKGEKIGYGNDFIAQKNMIIAVVFLGYYDGINRKLKNIGKVKIGNQLFTIVGNICMDMFMIDITNSKMKNYVGQNVLVFSDAHSWSKICGTIPYEILTSFSKCR